MEHQAVSMKLDLMLRKANSFGETYGVRKFHTMKMRSVKRDCHGHREFQLHVPLQAFHYHWNGIPLLPSQYLVFSV